MQLKTNQRVAMRKERGMVSDLETRVARLERRLGRTRSVNVILVASLVLVVVLGAAKDE